MAERGEGGDLHHGSSHDASPDDAANLGLPQPLRGEVDNGGPTGTESKGSMVAETAGSEIAESASVDKPTSTSTNPSKASPTKGYQYSPQTTPQPRDETSYFRPTETPSTSIHRGYPSHVSLSSSSKESSPLSSAHSSSVSIRAAAYSTRSSPGTSVPTDLLKDRQGTRDLSGLPTIGTNTTAAPTSAPVQARSTSRDDLSLIDSRQGYPVYPNQAFAALHSQIHPTYPSSSNRPRSSHRSPNFFGSNPAMSPQANRDYSPSENSSKTVGNTPASSPGLFTSDGHSDQQTYDEYGNHTSPYLTWTQVREPKETNKVVKSRDMISGRKSINQYEIISEVGRGISGKVKLGRNLETEEQVAIKVVPRYSKRRRLGRLGNPENDVKKEVAILKKARHEHIVALLEVIDDPDKAKVYIVLEYVALGEIPWRLRGKPEIVHVETRRIDRETRGIVEDEETIMDTQRVMSEAAMQRSRREQDLRRRQKTQARRSEFWSLEYGGEDDDVVTENAGSVKVPEQDTDAATLHRLESTTSLVSALTGRRSSQHTNSTAQGPLPYELDIPPLDSDNEDERSSSHPSHASSGIALQGSMAAELGSSGRRGRASSVAGSYVSNASADHRDSGIEDLSSVPILTLNQARVVLRDTVLGLEYLHYQGIIHRDIKPANLLWTSEHRVKISDFGVSYLGQPIQLDEAGEETTESEVKPLDEAIELAKTVGTPAFYAPELCRTDFLETGDAPPPVTGQIDVWALGVTLFCIVFARLPFIADDQFAMFKAIAEDELHIPRRRLKAVDTTGVSRSSSYSSKSTTLQHQYRSETELVYDRIDDDLYDLLKRLLIKDPTKRITIREIKRHPWVLEGISDPIAWLDETDPDRQHKGKKIEVSNEDIEQAVVPLGLIERMRSGVRKLGHAFGLGKVKDGRRRADSAFRSSDSPPPSTPNTSNNSSNRDLREARRASLRGDETILSALKASREGEHPLAHSVTASPDLSERPDFFQLPDGDTSATRSASLVMQEATAATPSTLRPTGPDRALSNSGASVKTIRAYQPVEPTTPISPGLPGHPTAVDPLGSSNLSGIFGGATRRTLVHKSSRSMAWSSEDEASSSGQDQSVDRVTMGSEDPHAVPSVAFSSTVAEGRVDTPAALVELPGSRPQMAVIPPSFDGRHPDLPRPSQASGRPTTAPATETPSVPVRRTSLRRPGDSTPEAFQRAQDEMVRRRQLEYERSQWKPPPAQSSALAHHSDAAPSSCPPSPDDDIFFDRQEEKVRKLQEGITPLPAPAQPMISSSSDDHFASSTSQTSHPSVISAGSSVTADDLPYHSKPVGGPAPAPAVTTISTRSMVSDDDPGYSGDHAAESGDEDEDSDDDEDLVMMPRRKTKAPDLAAVALPGSLAVEERRGRRDTGASVKTSRSGSSETTLRKVGSKEAVGK